MAINRRIFLKSIIGAGLTSSLITEPLLAYAQATDVVDFWYKNRTIELVRADNREKMSLPFFRNGQYDTEVYKAACWLLRDAKDMNQMIQMDIGVMNLMYALQEWARLAGVSNPLITVNSAYRTARRNATIENAARNSMHIRGQAVDITMRGITIEQLATMAKYFQVGGVGTYNSFVHIDTGRIRNWRG
ncbi:YcbK family protein [Neisseria sp. Ec49-e6-T10]|uniref:YcbK family protein n=1 Tax=Neisseria sp. Ec49-e6-T10 TaxID=3140744 RepID=UPI003EC00A49